MLTCNACGSRFSDETRTPVHRMCARRRRNVAKMDGLDALDKETACEERGGPETGGCLQARFAGNAAGLAPAVPAWQLFEYVRRCLDYKEESDAT